MGKLKTILTLVMVILGMLVVLAAIGLIYRAMQYLLLFGILSLIGIIVVRFLRKREPPMIDKSDEQQNLRQVERTLQKYKRNLR
jgi:hypothetical protein